MLQIRRAIGPLLISCIENILADITESSSGYILQKYLP
jgi:hypothetical protein